MSPLARLRAPSPSAVALFGFAFVAPACVPPGNAPPYDAGASGFQTLVNVIIPLSKPGIVIGSIFVITIVMGDFVTIGVMGGQQIASVGKVIQVQASYLQFPLAAANAVILLALVLMIIWALTRLVDIRKEL